MKKIILSLLTVAAVSPAFARSPSPVADCMIKGTNQVVDGSRFFSIVHEASYGGRCSYGKIASVPYSGRVYFNGRKVADNLSNASAADIKRIVRGLGGSGNCENFSCEEVVSVPVPLPLPPPVSGGGDI